MIDGPAEVICCSINEEDQEAFTITREDASLDNIVDILYSIHYYNIETEFRYRYDLRYLCANGTAG